MTLSRKDSLVGMVYVLAAITSWGVYFPYAKLILTKLSPDVFLVLRLGIGAAVLGLLTVRLGKSVRVERGDVASVIAAGVVGIVLHQLIQLTGLKYTTATNTGWILTLIPPVTGLLAWMFLKERITIRQMAGLLIAMIGVFEFVAKGKPSTLSFTGNVGDLLALGSVLTWSAYTIMTKSRLSRYDPLPLTTIHMVLAFAFFLVMSGWKMPAQLGVLDVRDWITIVAIGVVPSGLAYYWWNAGLKRLTAVNTATFLFIEAIVASVAGALLLGEAFTLPMVVFAGFIVIGVYIAQMRGRL
jgi:drug/metabolite transporter (DMT)-like permease